MNKLRLLSLCLAGLLVLGAFLPPSTAPALAGDVLPPADQQSTTGPRPPLAVQQRDAARSPESQAAVDGQVVLDVPNYLWRHGCGPTALGMVAGYWDAKGYGDLIAGGAQSQTAAVDQAIASGGRSGAPFPISSARHYEDYASPQDSYPNMYTDAVIGQLRTPHPDDSLADFMKTSRSTSNNYYGWSWFSDVGPAWNQYVSLKKASYGPSFTNYYWGNSYSLLTWEVFKREIDAGRPLVFLVDTDGNGGTDHFVPAIGYRENPRQYASWDTWGPSLRWENFAGIQSGVAWGIWGATAVSLKPQWTPHHKVFLPVVRQ